MQPRRWPPSFDPVCSVWQCLPITFKLPFTMISLVIAAVFGATALSLWHTQHTFQRELVNQADAMLDMLTKAVDDSLYMLDVDALADITHELKDYRDTITFCRIYDAEGRIIADTENHGTFSYSRDSVSLQSAIDPFGSQLVSQAGTSYTMRGDYLRAGRAVEVGEEHIGAISIGLSTTQLVTELRQTQLQGVLVALAATIVGTMIALLLCRSILRPIREMAAATQEIAEGDLSQRVSVAGGDEIAKLGTHFNVMVTQVEAMMERQKKHQEELVALLHARADAVRAAVHDLNHSVQANQSALDLWVMDLQDSHVDEAVIQQGQEHLESSFEQQRMLLQDMRDAALLETGNLVLRPEATDFRQLVNQVVTTLQPRYELMGCVLQVEAELGSTPLAWCDANRMRRVIYNILENALRYTVSYRDDGVVCVFITSYEDYVTCNISDNGRGIAAEDLSELGEKFRRIARGEHDPEGMGLGLNFAIGIMRLSGGSLDITSPGEGLGTTVTLQLPIEEQPQAKEVGKGHE